MRFHDAIEAETAAWDGDRVITHFLIQFKTGDRKNAGTDANITFEIGTLRLQCPDMPGDDNERGDYYTWAFPTDSRMTLSQLRKADIRLYHDNSGRNPGWYVDSALLQVGLDQPIAAPDNVSWHTYKLWENVGWLASDEAGGCQVHLQNSRLYKAAPVR